MVSELTVIIKDDERSLKYKSLIHETYSISESDPIVAQAIATALKEFKGEPSDINVKINMCVK